MQFRHLQFSKLSSDIKFTVSTSLHYYYYYISSFTHVSTTSVIQQGEFKILRRARKFTQQCEIQGNKDTQSRFKNG